MKPVTFRVGHHNLLTRMAKDWSAGADNEQQGDVPASIG